MTQKNRQVFEDIYNTLYELRQGNTEEFVHNVEISNWPFRII